MPVVGPSPVEGLLEVSEPVLADSEPESSPLSTVQPSATLSESASQDS
jgi:hypothetical protein